MIYHQILGSCAPEVVGLDDEVHVVAEYYHPFSLIEQSATFDSTLGDLLAGDNSLLLKGDAIVAYAEALKTLKTIAGAEALELIDTTIEEVQAAEAALADDPDLAEIESLLETYRDHFE